MRGSPDDPASPHMLEQRRVSEQIDQQRPMSKRQKSLSESSTESSPSRTGRPDRRSPPEDRERKQETRSLSRSPTRHTGTKRVSVLPMGDDDDDDEILENKDRGVTPEIIGMADLTMDEHPDSDPGPASDDFQVVMRKKKNAPKQPPKHRGSFLYDHEKQKNKRMSGGEVIREVRRAKAVKRNSRRLSMPAIRDRDRSNPSPRQSVIVEGSADKSPTTNRRSRHSALMQRRASLETSTSPKGSPKANRYTRNSAIVHSPRCSLMVDTSGHPVESRRSPNANRRSVRKSSYGGEGSPKHSPKTSRSNRTSMVVPSRAGRHSMILPDSGFREELMREKNLLCNGCGSRCAEDGTGGLSKGTGKYRKVLVPMDETEASQTAFEYYFEWLAQPTDDVILLHMFDPPLPPTMNVKTMQQAQTQKDGKRDKRISAYGGDLGLKDAGGDAWKIWRAKIDMNLEPIRQIFKGFEARCRETGVSCMSVCKAGSPGEGILDAANKENEVNLIVMGSRSMNTFKRKLFGSVTDYVMQKSHVPVLTVPQTKTTKTSVDKNNNKN